MVKVKSKSSRKEARKPATCKEPSQCPHEHFRYEVPDRRGIDRDKHINILATPKGYRWEDIKREGGDDGKIAKRIPIRRRSCPDKYAKKPEKAYVHNFLAEVWSFLTPEMADRLKNMLMNEFSMSSKDADEFIFKQREANIMNSSTVSLYKKPRDIGDGKVVLDSVIKMRTPNKTYCDKFPKSNIGIRNSWIKDFSDLISNKMADYVLDTMTAERTERQQEIAQNLLNRFNTLLEQKASLANPKTQTHKTMVLVADRLSLWLDKNVPMSKETAQRLKDIEEAQERKKMEEEKRKQMKEEREAARVRPESEEDEEEGEGDQGPGGPPGAPGIGPGEPGAETEGKPGEPGAETVEPGVQAGEAGAGPSEEPGTDTGAEPGKTERQPGAEPDGSTPQPDEPGAEVGEPGGQPDEIGPKPGEDGAQPEEPGAQQGESEVKPGEPGSQAATTEGKPGEPGTEPETPGQAPDGATKDDGTKPGDETRPEDVARPGSPTAEPGKGEEGVGGSEKTEDGKPEQTDETRPEAQPGAIDAVDEQQGVESQNQEAPASPAEEAQSPSDQPDSKGEEQSSDVPKPSDTQPEASDEGRSLGEPKGDEDATIAQPESAMAQDEPPPSSDEVQLTPSEIQQNAVEEAGLDERAQEKPQEATLPEDADQKTAGDTEPASEGDTPETGPAQRTASEEEVARTEPGTTPGGESVPGAEDERYYEPSDKPAGVVGRPGDQTAPQDRELAPPGEGPSTKPGERVASQPGARELTPEQKRQLEVIQAVASKILETPIDDTPRQEAIKDVLEKHLEKELGDDDKRTIDQVAAKVGTWIDKMVEQVETEYGDRDRRTPSGLPSEPGRRTSPPVSQKPKGSIFVVKKVDDRGYDVDLISNTRAQEKIRLARGRSPARAEVPNPDAALEPADLKNWAQWASAVSDMAQSWAEWIEDTVQEAQKRGEILQTDDSPERLQEWEEFRGTRAQGAQQWRKTKQQVDQTANLWSQKGMKARELRKPPSE